jgi:hypothetical protein
VISARPGELDEVFHRSSGMGMDQKTYPDRRDYLTTVDHPPFTQSFLAPKFVTTENKDLVGDISVTNGTTISPLVGECRVASSGPV